MSFSQEIQYLGSAMLTTHVRTTELATLQKPLIDLYGASFEPDTGYPRSLPVQRLTITDRGLIITATDSVNHDEQDTFYSMSLVTFWEAVKFVPVQVGVNKFRGAFEPIGESQMTKVNLYMDLENHCCHLAKQVKQHPALFVLVIRRANSVKLQAYACSSAHHAAFVVENLTRAHQSYKVQQTNSSHALGCYHSDDVVSNLGTKQLTSLVNTTHLKEELMRTRGTSLSEQAIQQRKTCNDAPERIHQSTSTATPVTQQTIEVLSYPQSMEDVTTSEDHHHRSLVVTSNQNHAATKAVYQPSENNSVVPPKCSVALDSFSGVDNDKYEENPQTRPMDMRADDLSLFQFRGQHLDHESTQAIARSKTFKENPTYENLTPPTVLHRSLTQRTSVDVYGTSPSNIDNKDVHSTKAIEKFTNHSQTYEPVSGNSRGIGHHSQQDRMKNSLKSELMSPVSMNDNSHQYSNVDNEVAPFDFMYGFNATPTKPTNLERQYQPTAASDYKPVPVAMVQPRKIGGIQVLPNMFEPANIQLKNNSEHLSNTEHLQVTVGSVNKKKEQNVDDKGCADPSRSNTLQVGEVYANKKDFTQEINGIPNLRTVRGTAGVTSIPSSGDSNYRELMMAKSKINDMPVKNLKTAVESKHTHLTNTFQSFMIEPRGVTNNFEVLRATSSNADISFGHEKLPPTRQKQRVSDNESLEKLSSKDKEIVSVAGSLRTDYEPSMATLQSQGTNFEKYLGYFP